MRAECLLDFRVLPHPEGAWGDHLTIAAQATSAWARVSDHTHPGVS